MGIPETWRWYEILKKLKKKVKNYIFDNAAFFYDGCEYLYVYALRNIIGKMVLSVVEWFYEVLDAINFITNFRTYF